MTTPSKTVSESKFARMRASVKVNPPDSALSSLCTPPTTSKNVSSPSSSASNTGSVPEPTSPPNCSKALRTHFTPRLSAASKLRTKEDQGTFLSTAPSSFSLLLFRKLHHQTGLSSSLLFLFRRNSLLRILNDVANKLIHGGFINSSIKILSYVISSLIILCASNDVSMHLQKHIEESYSSVPQI